MTTTGFIGNDAAGQDLINWCKEPVVHPRLCKECVCVVAGGPGTGKSYGVKYITESIKKQVYVLNKDGCNNSKDFKEYLIKLVTSNVVLKFSNTHLDECVLFIDDVDTLLAADRTFINSFNLLYSADIPGLRIIMTCNISEFKTVTKNLQYDKSVILNKIHIKDIVAFITHQTHTQTHTHTEIETVIEPIKIKEIAIDCQGNLSVAMNMMELCKSSTHTTHIDTDTDTDSYSKRSKKTPDVFSEVANIYRLTSREDIRGVFEQDPWLHPLRFHENLLHELQSRHGSVKKKTLTYVHILKNLCIWDQMMACAKGSDMSFGIEQATNTAIALSDIPRIKTHNAVESVDNFTRMFNYLSLKKKNQLAIYDTQSPYQVNDFPWQHVGSVHKRVYELQRKSIAKSAKSRHSKR